jgi:hypothetical protein
MQATSVATDYMDWSAEDHGATPRAGLYNPHRFFYSVDKEYSPYAYCYSYDHHTVDQGQSTVYVIDHKIFYSTDGVKTDTPTPIHKIIMARYQLT